MYPFTTTLNIVCSLASWEAQALKSSNIDVEHLFLGLCKLEDVLAMDYSSIENMSREDWGNFLKEGNIFVSSLIKVGIDCKKARRRFREILRQTDYQKGPFVGHLTERSERLLSSTEALCIKEDLGDKVLEILFMYILRDGSESLERLFREHNVNLLLLEDYMEYLQKFMGFCRLFPTVENGKEHDSGDTTASTEARPSQPAVTTKTSTPFLDKFGRDLTKLAREGKFEPVIGRSEEIRKIAQILVQKKKNNPILVGDAGVGKTCLVEGFAQRVVAPDAPELIKDFRIVEIAMGSLVAGTKFRGEFEEKLETIINEASSDPNIVLFIDEIHTMVNAGATSDGSLSAGNILKPMLARGSIKCIGATTVKEYRLYVEKDSALERRFQVIWVDEPTRDEAIQILKGLKSRYEEYYTLVIPDRVIEKTVELSMRYMADFKLPDKAIDIIDQACARKLLKTLSPVDFGMKGEKSELKLEDVARVISERCRIPVNSLTVEESRRLLEMEQYLKKRVMGQDGAIKDISEVVRTSKTDLGDPNKPKGVFLFLGMTGIGKTELAKALAEFLFFDEKQLISFDMSEYMEKHSVAKLIGAPPGYVGYEEEGLLTSKVRTSPFSVILFDEIEKAHPDVFDLFLQIFDEGRLTDAHGRKVSFSETIIIMTSNLGSSMTSAVPKRQIGFSLDSRSEGQENASTKDEAWKKDYETNIMYAVSGAFRPEILNRIQKKVIFYPLGREVMTLIIDKIAARLNDRLKLKGMGISLDDAARSFLMEKGYSEKFGAREMQRAFDLYVSQPIAAGILNGDIKEGSSLLFTVHDDNIRFTTI